MKPLIEVKNVSRVYEQGEIKVHALKDVTLDILKGAFIAFVGPSGSGKTTLLNLIGGLDEPTSGSVIISGRDLKEMSKKERSHFRRDKIGFIFQAYNLIPVLTALENTEFVMMLQGVEKAVYTEKARALLSEVGLAGMEDRFPYQLSGGQQQRVAVARALASTPLLILADEPTANLDSKTSKELLALMRELNEKHGVTFCFSTHDQNVMEAAKKRVVLVDGQIERIEE